MARAFVAIRPPDPVLDAIGARVDAVVMPGARRTTRDQWHLTIRFLGDDVDIPSVAAGLGAAPLDVRPGEIRFAGAFALGNPRRARILALGLAAGETWMATLAATIDERVQALGIAGDERHPEFLAHLTLARFRTPTDLRPLCAAIGPEPVGPEFRVDEVVLFESELLADGARHTPRARFALGG